MPKSAYVEANRIKSHLGWQCKEDSIIHINKENVHVLSTAASSSSSEQTTCCLSNPPPLSSSVPHTHRKAPTLLIRFKGWKARAFSVTGVCQIRWRLIKKRPPPPPRYIFKNSPGVWPLLWLKALPSCRGLNRRGSLEKERGIWHTPWRRGVKRTKKNRVKL